MARRLGVGSATLLAGLALGCAGLSPFGGGSLELNVTDVQTRPLTVRINATGASIFEMSGSEDIPLGEGSATIDRYVVQRVTFGRNLATGLFVCPAPCSRPTQDYMVAYSPDQLFTADGELRLQFRLVRDNGPDQEISHTVSPQALPDLWRQPEIEIEAAGEGS